MLSTRIPRLFALVALVAALVAACAAAATAAVANPSATTNPGAPALGSGGSSAAAKNYLGAWFPSPTNGTSVDMYRADLTPFSKTDQPEATNFACVYQKNPDNSVTPASPYGYPISSSVLTIVGAILSTARQIYSDPAPSDDIQIPGGIKGLDHVQWNSGGGMDSQFGIPSNLDWSKNPSAAMYYFLSVAKQKLKDGGVTIDSSAKPSKSGGSVFDQPSLSNQPDSGTLSAAQEDKNAASLIFLPGNPADANPSTLANNVPASCNIGDFSNFPTLGNMLSISKLLHDPATWFSNLFAFVPGTIVLGIYNFVEPWAFKFAFWTPHTERGDTLLDVTNLSCTVDSAGNPSPDQKSWCNNGTPTGFNTQNLNITKTNVSSSTPGWIRMSLELQWLVSALYFIALFGCAILFMLRGHRSTTYHVVKMIPRIFSAVLLTVFSSYLIGGAITLSNHLVVSLFSSDSTFTSIRALQEGLVNTGTAFGVSNPLSAWMQVIMVGAADYFLILILLLSIARQLVLVFLVCVAPIACFCIIHPGLERHWKRYLRVCATVIITPAIMAMMLRLGVSFNPVATQSASSTSMVMGFFGSIITLITFWSLGYTSKLSWAVIRDRQMGSSALGRLGGALGSAGMAVSPYMPFVGAQLRGASRAAGALGSLDNRGAYGMRNMLPDHKMRSLHGVNLGGQRAVRDMYKDVFRGMSGGGKGSDDAAMAASMMPMAPFMGGAAAALEAGAGGSGRPRHRGTPAPSSPIGKVAGGATGAAARGVSGARDLSDTLARVGGDKGVLADSAAVGRQAADAVRRRAANRGGAARAIANVAAPVVGAAAAVGAATGPVSSKYVGASAALAGLVLDRSNTFHARVAEFDNMRHRQRGQRPLRQAQASAHINARKAAYREHASERKLHGFAPIPENEFNSNFDQEQIGSELRQVQTTRRGKHKTQYFVDQPMPEPDFDVLATPAASEQGVRTQMDAQWEHYEAERASSGTSGVMDAFREHAALRAKRA